MRAEIKELVREWGRQRGSKGVVFVHEVDVPEELWDSVVEAFGDPQPNGYMSEQRSFEISVETARECGWSAEDA